MLPSQAFHRVGPANAGAVCLARHQAGRARARRGERGAVLVHVAVALTGLLAFSALSIDLGTLWVARGQAQNAVDAAALAGAIALGRDPTNTSAAESAARAIAQQHKIWGEAIDDASLSFNETCPSGSPATPGGCMSVAVERGGGAGAPLPVFFARLLGAAPMYMRASASAKVMTGNTSACVRPLAIMDAWSPATGTWSWDDRFAPPDAYAPTGHTTTSLSSSLGEVPLSRGRVQEGVFEPPAGNEYFSLDISRPGSPTGTGSLVDRGDRYQANMTGCNDVAVGIGESVAYWDSDHETTNNLAQAIIDSDPGAYWDGTAIRGSAFPVSPRLLTIALVDPQVYVTQQPLSLPDRHYVIRNLVGFFITRTHSPVAGLRDPLVGVFLGNTGSYSASADNVAPDAAFLKNIALVR